MVAVLGDASGSMEMAIKCSSCLGSLLSAALKADLSFFNETSFRPAMTPTTANCAIKVVESTKAEGGTSMAAALWPFYEKKQKVDLFVLVSDEGENEKCEGYNFAELFVKYTAEVSAACKVMLVSFLPPGVDGAIKVSLDEAGVECRQFRLDLNRPDTSKFDSILGLAALERSYFEKRAQYLTSTTSMPESVADMILAYC
jgi:hypothetical protein